MATPNPLIQGVIDKDFSRVAVVFDGLTVSSYDADTGPDSILTIIKDGIVFSRDDTDTTTADDGITCIVTADGVRFKASPFSGQILKAYLVDTFTNAPPGTVAKGDQVGVGPAPTGDFAGKANNIALALAGDPSPVWDFTAPVEGMTAYAADVETWRQVISDLTWQDGFKGSYQASSIPPEALIAKTFNAESVNVTPPVSPTSGQYFIVGAGATGAFASQDQKVAKWNGVSWEFITPTEGDRAYNRATNSELVYRDSAWASGDFEAVIKQYAVVTLTGTVAVPANGTGSFSAPPINSEGLQIAEGEFSLDKATNRLDIQFNIGFTQGATQGNVEIGLFIDGGVNAVDWTMETVPVSFNKTLIGKLSYSPGDTDLHTYRIRIVCGTGGNFQKIRAYPSEVSPT